MISAPPLLHALLGAPAMQRLFDDAADLAAMLRFEVALAEAQAELGLIAPEAAEAIATALAEFSPDWPDLAAGLARDGVVVPALLRQLRAKIGAEHGKALHCAATSQDVIDTSLALRLKPALASLDEAIAGLLTRFSLWSRDEGNKSLMAHTRMQAALPFTAADKIETWAAPLRRHRTRLGEITPRLIVVQLGGPVGTRREMGDHGDAVAAGLARRLDLAAAPAWHSQRDGIGELAGFLSLLSGSLGKIGQDIALMAQSEVGAVELRGGGGSSAMAHKRNPVGAELLVTLARFNAGLNGTLHQALVHENERSGAAWTLEWLVLPQMLVASASGLALASHLVEGAHFMAR